MGEWEDGQPDSGKEMCDISELCAQITFNAETLQVNDIACNIEGDELRNYVRTESRCVCEEASNEVGPLLDADILMSKSPGGLTYNGCVIQWNLTLMGLCIGLGLLVLAFWAVLLRRTIRRMIRRIDREEAENERKDRETDSMTEEQEERFHGMRRGSVTRRDNRAESISIDDVPLPSKFNFGDETLMSMCRVPIGFLIILLLSSGILSPWYNGDICPHNEEISRQMGGEMTLVQTTVRSVKFPTARLLGLQSPDATAPLVPGMKAPAPRFLTAGAAIPDKGVQGDLYFVENLCDPGISCRHDEFGCQKTGSKEIRMLDCDSRPIRINPEFNQTLKGKILITDKTQDPRIFKTGFHELSLILAPLEPSALLYGIVVGFTPFFMPYTPGLYRRWHAFGEDTWEGIEGDPNNATRVEFPVADITGPRGLPLVIAGAIREQKVTVKLTPTLKNPYQNSFCGNWVILRLFLIILYAANFEKAVQGLRTHIKLSGVQILSFAQNMLMIESFLPIFACLVYFDPGQAWYFGLSDVGAGISGTIGASFLSSCSSLLLAAYWIQMVKSNGLSNFIAKTKLGKACIAFCLVITSVTFYTLVTEAFLTMEWWDKVKISIVNSHHYRYSIFCSQMLFGFTSLYFIGSTMVAHFVLSHTKSVSNTKKAVLRALMRRIRLSGVLMTLIFIQGCLSFFVIFNPIGYVLNQSVSALLQFFHSRLQIDSFIPVGGIKAGPLRSALGFLEDQMRLIWRAVTFAASAEAEERDRVITVLHTVGTPLAKVANPAKKSTRQSVAQTLKRVTLEVSIDDLASREPAPPPNTLATLDERELFDNEGSGVEMKDMDGSPVRNPLHGDDIEKGAEPKPEPAEKAAWEMPGLSVALLDALISAYEIDRTWTLVKVKDEIVIPATKVKRTTYVEALSEHPHKLDGWLGKPGYFVSHWWGYSFLDLVEMIRLHSMKLKLEGITETPYYFIDAFTVNQHSVSLGSTSDTKTYENLVSGLKKSLLSCGTLVLCCAEGGDGMPGWEYPAPIGRIWCLFELYQAIEAKVKVDVQLAPRCEREFRLALHDGGLLRVEDALAGIDAEMAEASVESDRVLILNDIKKRVGIIRFNKAIRKFLKLEFRSIATKETLVGR